MTAGVSSATVPTVLHVIPTAAARGAQREARALADHLDRPGSRRHRLLTLFSDPGRGNDLTGGDPAEVPTDLSLGDTGTPNPGVGIDLRVVRRLRSFLAGADPAVVVAHGSEPLKYLAAAMVGRSRPLAYYAIGTYSGSHGRAQEWLWRRLLRRPDVIVAEGEEVRSECITRFGVPDRRVVFVPNGRDPAVFRPGDPSHRSAPPQLAFVGALVAGKRPERFLEVVRALQGRGTPLRAVMIGDGPLRDRVADQARRAGVEVLGARSDVPDLLRRADVMVFPSLPSGEGMPGVLIEAGMSGLPVVATDVPGVRSIIDDQVTGFVVGTEEVEAMVAAVTRLLGDSGLRASMGHAARDRCTTRFALEAVARQWSAVLDPLVERSRPRPAHP